MTVVDFFAFSRRSWRLIVVCILVGLAVAGLYAFFAPKVYVSTSAGFVIVADGSATNAVTGQSSAISRANAYLPLISSSPVYSKIQADPQVNPGGGPLDGRLSASVADGSTLIEVTASASSPEAAAALANGALQALADVITDIETEASPTKVPGIKVIPLENAVAPSRPASPNVPLVIAIGAIAGLALGYLLAFLRRALDIRVRTADALNELVGVGVLGRIPKLSKRDRDDSASTDPRAAESFRALRTGLRFSSVDDEVSSIMVTSANQGEGKTTISVAVAQVFAESGRKTILVDADLRRPGVSKALGIDGSIGLSEVLSHQVPLADAIRATGSSGLLVLPAGRTPPNPSEMLGSAALKSLIAELSRDYFVVVDVPPLLPVTDASLVSTVVDGVVFVAASGKTRRPEVTASKRLLDQVHARVLGTVLNMVTARDGDVGYYYYYRREHYYYEAPPTADGKPQKKRKKRRSGSRRSSGVPAGAGTRAAARSEQ